MLLKLALFAILFIFLLCLHPLQKTLTLILFVLIILFNLSNYSSHWVCYLFALIYFGGVLILFTYISSVVPNFAPNRISLILPLLTGFYLSLISSNNFWPLTETFNPCESPIPLIRSTPTFFLLFFILGLVLILLILSIRILRNFKAPLRNI